MIAVVAPEPASWVEPLVAAALELAPVALFAPWVVPAAVAACAPSRLRPALASRLLRFGSDVPAWPLSLAAEGVRRAWIQGDPRRRIESRFLLRQAVDSCAALWLPRSAGTVIAPSFAARRTFALARRRGVATFLVEDLPAIRELQQDLDRAAAAHPLSPLLRAHRTHPDRLARQAAERVLADRLLVRGWWARAQLLAAGRRPAELVRLQEPDPPVCPDAGPSDAPGPIRVLLAGTPDARHGLHEAIRALEGHDAVLLLGAGRTSELKGVLPRPNVRRATRAEQDRLAGVDVVFAPAWCEVHPPEVALAAANGVPVVATARAAGWVELARHGLEIAPGDVAALRAALGGLRDSEPNRVVEPAVEVIRSLRAGA